MSQPSPTSPGSDIGRDLDGVIDQFRAVVVMLVHGFPQNWWEWHELIGPLAGDGYRVLCPDLRGAGWSSAPRDGYFKADMAEDLAAVLDRLGVGPARLVAHDWGGSVAILMMLRHPEKGHGLLRPEHAWTMVKT